MAEEKKIERKGIKIKTDLEWGDIFYIINDPFQYEHTLVGLILMPGNSVKFQLSYLGEIKEVYDFETSNEIDKLKAMENKNDKEEP